MAGGSLNSTIVSVFGGYAVVVLCVLGVCSGCSRAGGVFCVLTLASSTVQFHSTSQDALGFFRSSFVRFESIKKLLHFVSEARKTGGSIIRYKKLKLKLCLTISFFGDSGHNPGIARSRAQYPPRYFGGGRGESPIDT